MPSSSAFKPRKRPTQARARRTWDAILEATAQVLVEEGFDKASTNRIAEVAGVSVGSLYQYFPNKEALVLAVVQQHSDVMMGLLEQSVSSLAGEPLEVAVRTYVRAMIAKHTVEPELHRVLVQQVLHLGQDHVQRVQARATQIVRDYLEQHREQFLPHDLDLAAFVLVTSVESITHAAVIDRTGDLDPDALADEIIALVLRYLTGTG